MVSSKHQVKTEDSNEDVIETVDDEKHRKSKKSHKKHNKKSKKRYSKQQNDEKGDEKADADCIISELEQNIKQLKGELMKSKKKDSKKKVKQEEIEEPQPIKEPTSVEIRETETEQDLGDEAIEVEQEISDGAIQEAKRKTKEVIKKESKSKKIQKQEEEVASDDIAKEKIEKFNEAQREAYDMFQKKYINKSLSKKRKYSGYGGTGEGGDEYSKANDLINRMKEAVELDKFANKNKQPAIKRLMMSQELFSEVKKISIQDKFLENGGCQAFADWINQMPDGTFPNISLVEGVLNCIDTMRIDIQHLEESNLAKAVQCYAENLAGLPPIQNLAKRIIEKWSRLIYGIKSHFSEGLDDYEASYRNLQKRLDKIRQANANEVNSDLEEENNHNEEKKMQKRKNNIKSPMSDHILTAQSFARKNAFDFIERPDIVEKTIREKKKDPNCGRARLEKVLERLRKQNLPKQYSS